MKSNKKILATTISILLTSATLSGCNSGGVISDASAAPTTRDGRTARKAEQNIIYGGAPAGSIIEAFGDNGSYYQTTAGIDQSTDLGTFALPVPTQLGLRLVVKVNPDTADEVIVPVAFRNNRNEVANRFEIGSNDSVDLGYLPVPSTPQETSGYWDTDGDGKFDVPFIVDDFGANNPLSQADADNDGIDDWNDPDGGGYHFTPGTVDPLDTDGDAIINPHDADFKPNLISPDIDHDGLKDNRDDANAGNAPGKNHALRDDRNGDGYQDSDADQNGIPDFDQDNHSPSGYRSNQAEDSSGNAADGIQDQSGTTDNSITGNDSQPAQHGSDENRTEKHQSLGESNIANNNPQDDNSTTEAPLNDKSGQTDGLHGQSSEKRDNNEQYSESSDHSGTNDNAQNHTLSGDNNRQQNDEARDHSLTSDNSRQPNRSGDREASNDNHRQNDETQNQSHESNRHQGDGRLKQETGKDKGDHGNDRAAENSKRDHNDRQKDAEKSRSGREDRNN